MRLFVDTADLGELRELAETGLVDGVTTNPSLIAKSGRNILEVIAEICALVPGPVSAEVAAVDAPTMIAEGKRLRQIADNVVVKAPLTWDGLKATKALADEGHPVNVTLCFSASQAMLAAKAGAAYISPFIGRLDDIGQDGLGLIRDIRVLFDNYDNLKTEILSASIRSPGHVQNVALAGSDCATIPPATFRQLAAHPLTDRGLEAFMKDWAGTGQSIL